MIEIDKDKLIKESSLVIDYLRKARNLSEIECLALLKFMLDSFPKEYIVAYKLRSEGKDR